MEEENNPIQISASASTVHAGSYKNKESFVRVMAEQAEEERILTGEHAVDVDLSRIRGIPPPVEEEEEEEEERKRVIPKRERYANHDEEFLEEEEEEADLEGLAELVPELKTGKSPPRPSHRHSDNDTHMQVKISHADSTITNQGRDDEDSTVNVLKNNNNHSSKHASTMAAVIEEQDNDEESENDGESEEDEESESSEVKTTNDLIQTYQQGQKDGNHDAIEKVPSEGQQQVVPDAASSSSGSSAGHTHASDTPKDTSFASHEQTVLQHHPAMLDRSNPKPYHQTTHQRHLSPPPHEQMNDESFMTNQETPSPSSRNNYQPQSSAASLSTATQSHEVRMPMYLPNFRPATGCTNASDFVVRCFVARLRAGITVVKHGRSRWCKSRLRVLHVHSDGRSLTWRPAQGEPTTNKRPPRLDLSTCLEVRHAWSPDPLNPMFTGTPILRSKCEASNAFKSFALIFPKRTVDITAVTADQCKVLMEGFSALCFRLHVANMTGRGAGQEQQQDNSKTKVNDSSGHNNITSTMGNGKVGMKIGSTNTAHSTASHLHPDQIPR